MKRSSVKQIMTGVALISGVAMNAVGSPISIQPIQVCSSDATKCAVTGDLYLSETNKIWAQAGHSISYLPLKTINRDIYFTIDGTLDFFALMLDPFAGRSLGAYDMWIVDSIAGAWGRGLLGGDGLVISDNIFAAGRIDTIAHELGHNTGLNHTLLSTTDASSYLMADGSIRKIPSGVGNIAPDGKQLDRFNPILPSASVDTIGATPFGTSDFFDVQFKSGSASDLFMLSVSVNLAPVGAFVDSSNAPPGRSGSPLSFSSFNGLGLSDIAPSGFQDGSQLMTLGFANESFGPGDSFAFGVDMDLFSNIDGFGATPQELNGTQVTFAFSNGYSFASALDDFIAPSTFDPLANIDKLSSIAADPDPITITTVPEPSTVSLLSVALGFLAYRARRIV